MFAGAYRGRLPGSLEMEFLRYFNSLLRIAARTPRIHGLALTAQRVREPSSKERNFHRLTMRELFRLTMDAGVRTHELNF